MPAAVVRGIILSISVITALGIAVLENPAVQVWVEEQRQKIIELLRSIGEELDPESRRQAEAFAYEGRTPATDAGLRRESDGAREAAAVATGRALNGSPGPVRRAPGRALSDPDEAEERRRKGREYLARRNAQMIEMRERRKASSKLEGTLTSPSSISFDTMVDADGKLKSAIIEEKELPPPPVAEPVPEPIKEQMREVERHLVHPLAAGGEASSSAGMSGFQMGSYLSNPFSDEYAMDLDRSETPKPPPVPPKVQLDHGITRDDVGLPTRHDSLPKSNARPDSGAMPGSYASGPQQDLSASTESLSFEEQLALAEALSLSEAESAASAAARQVQPQEDDFLKAAIAASLEDAPNQSEAPELLVDLTPVPTEAEPARQNRGNWMSSSNNFVNTSLDTASVVQPSSQAWARVPRSEASEDELYRITPQLTRARLASLDAQHATTSATHLYLPVREAAESQAQWLEPQSAPAASFDSAPSSAAQFSSTHTFGRDESAQLVDVSDVPDRDDTRTPTLSAAPSSVRFETDSESETFASVTGISRAQSGAPSIAPSDADVEVIDVLEDSDIDMFSEEGSGIRTPDSWSEVGSRDGEESDDDRPQQHIQL
ncbi:Ubiquitin-interacting motif [Teratosphaeria destructans]|uniref:Ubiquitin-interacting motif n=1 Tax=Teratosphaeria destructans TaxID=418781 RepID=A0A9W7SPB3_9PEZI|nr:Ubiquitin-interacting motif [Teratosphaeria destructans]